MDNDEREHRDMPSDDPERPQSAEPGEEHGTSSWPEQDTAAPRPADDAVPPEPAGEPVAAEPAEAEATQQGASGEDALRDGAPPTSPPAEVEAYGAEPGEVEADTSEAVAAHSVPATSEPGESTQCPRCGTLNRPGIAFCSNCGQRLVAPGAPTTVARPETPDGTQACPRCGTHNRAGTAFCQNCGANLQAAPGATPSERAAAATAEPASTHAFLGPIVLLVGAVGIAVGWLLPFALGTGSLYDRAFGDPSGYGVAFWSGYDGISGLAQQAYFGFAAPAPILVLLLALLAVGGMLRARAGTWQMIGLLVALLWAVGLLALFIVVEIVGSGGTDLPGVLRALSPAGIIFALASLIVLIGCITRFGRG